MATVNLGRIKPVFKGAYAGGTAYVVDDIVTSGNETFICILASTGNATSDATYWTKLASKGQDGTNGSDGTDLTTTLTAQGDIVYRNASGLAKLGAGTSGQFLKTSGTGANPVWADAGGGDYVKLADVNGGGSATLALDNLFTSTYDTYKVILTYRQNDKVKFNWRWRNSSGEVSSSSYYGARIGVEANSSGTSRVSSPIWGTNDFSTDQFAQASNSRPAVITGTFYKPTDNNNNKFWKLEHIGYNDSKYIWLVAAGEIASTGAMTGIQVQTSTGHGFDATSNITAYGIKG